MSTPKYNWERNPKLEDMDKKKDQALRLIEVLASGRTEAVDILNRLDLVDSLQKRVRELENEIEDQKQRFRDIVTIAEDYTR